jgi:hypothetical protein
MAASCSGWCARVDWRRSSNTPTPGDAFTRGPRERTASGIASATDGDALAGRVPEAKTDHEQPDQQQDVEAHRVRSGKRDGRKHIRWQSPELADDHGRLL